MEDHLWPIRLETSLYFYPSIAVQSTVRDAAALSALINAQGIVEMAIYHTLFRSQTIDGDTFNTLILSTLLIASIVTIFVRLIYDYELTYRGYQKRNILHMADHAELRVLVCAHRQDDVLTAVKALEVSNPTKESPIAAYAVNLVELVGRATPLLINHRMGQNASSAGSRSQQMINTLLQFENRYSSIVSCHAHTSVSLPRFVHHDICSLAFDKFCSLIILPFHRKWNHHGQIVFDGNIIRTINRNVLEMAPCSVAILVDRRKIRRESEGPNSSSDYHVGVAFLGGDDDREALAYGRRMAMSSRVHLTVVRIVAADVMGENQWDSVLDTEMLKEVKMQSALQSNIEYREEKAKDGPETALIINGMEEAFDLIITGRRHKEDSSLLSGITEWTDFPELGPVGDILATSDIQKPVSVLVVQQQILRSK